MRIALRLKSQLSELTRVADAMARLGAEQHLPTDVVGELTLVLEEVISNIIRHGCAGREDRQISLALDLSSEAITVTVQDDGTSFNPLTHPEPDVTRPLEAREVGGLGIFLVRRLMDEVTYQRDGGQNVLRMTRRIHPQ